MQALGITKSLLQEGRVRGKGREGPIRSQAYFLGGDRSSGAQEVTARRRRRSAKAARRLPSVRLPFSGGRYNIQEPLKLSIQLVTGPLIVHAGFELQLCI